MEDIKQYTDLLADELNLKEIATYIATSEKGELYIVYNRLKREFRLELCGKMVDSPTLLEKLVHDLYGK